MSGACRRNVRGVCNDGGTATPRGLTRQRLAQNLTATVKTALHRGKCDPERRGHLRPAALLDVAQQDDVT